MYVQAQTKGGGVSNPIATSALEVWWVVIVTSHSILPGNLCTGGWLGLGSGLDRQGKSLPHRDVAISYTD